MAFLGRALRSPASSSDLLAGHLSCARVAEICLLRTTPRIGEIDAHHGAFGLVDFFPTIVTDKSGYACH
jgi:hypothetical protein